MDRNIIHIDIPPYIEPKQYYKNKHSRGFGSIIVLSILTFIVSVILIILGIYLGM